MKFYGFPRSPGTPPPKHAFRHHLSRADENRQAKIEGIWSGISKAFRKMLLTLGAKSNIKFPLQTQIQKNVEKQHKKNAADKMNSFLHKKSNEMQSGAQSAHKKNPADQQHPKKISRSLGTGSGSFWCAMLAITFLKCSRCLGKHENNSFHVNSPNKIL